MALLCGNKYVIKFWFLDNTQHENEVAAFQDPALKDDVVTLYYADDSFVITKFCVEAGDGEIKPLKDHLIAQGYQAWDIRLALQCGI